MVSSASFQDKREKLIRTEGLEEEEMLEPGTEV